MRTLGASGGDFNFTVAEGIEAIRLRIVELLRFWRGEWFLDTSRGIPYLPSLLGRRGSLVLLRQVITANIRSVEGVTAVRNVEIDFKSEFRRVFYRADVDTIYGTIDGLEAESPVLPLAA